jgi:hypothetical protein
VTYFGRFLAYSLLLDVNLQNISIAIEDLKSIYLMMAS